MKRFIPIVLGLIGFPLNILADESAFEDSSLLSKMYISSSQSYLIKKQSCELVGIFSRGNLVSKTIDFTLEAKSQGGGFHCGQSLEQNSAVIGVKGDIQQSTMDGVIMRFEDLTSNYQPYIAFQLSPNFSFGVSEEIEHTESKTLTGNSSSSSHRLLLSGTWHEGPWETTLSYGDRYRDTMDSNVDIPRSLGLAVRHAFSPLLTAGLVYAKIDYPGIASGGESKAIGHEVAAVISSQVSDVVNVELSYMTEINTQGNDAAKSHIIGLLGQYKINSETKIGGFLNQFKGSDDALDISMSAFGFSVSMSR